MPPWTFDHRSARGENATLDVRLCQNALYVGNVTRDRALPRSTTQRFYVRPCILTFDHSTILRATIVGSSHASTRQWLDTSAGVDQHHTACMFFSAFMHCALAPILVQSPHLCSTLSLSQFSFSEEISDRKVIGHSCSSVPLKTPLGARYKHTSISHVSDSLTKGHRILSKSEKMCNSVVQQIAHHVERHDRSAHVRHSDVCDPSGSIARRTPQVKSPTSFNMKVVKTFCRFGR